MIQQTPAKDLDKLMQLVREAAEQLTPKAIHQLVGHPNVVHSALAVAAGTLEVQYDDSHPEALGNHKLATRVSRSVAKSRLAARTQGRSEEELLTADGLARYANLKTRQSIHAWLKKGRVIGWSGAKRGVVFPSAQLDERGQPPPDLNRVIPFFADHYSAWVWLTTPLPALDGQTPLALLRAGDSDRVVAAAAGDAQGDFA